MICDWGEDPPSGTMRTHFMRPVPLIAVLMAGFFSFDSRAAQISTTAICGNIAAELRAAPDQDPWLVLTQGKTPFVEVAGDSEMKALGSAEANNDGDLVNRSIG